MPHKLVFTPQAAHDLDQIEAFIALKKSPRTASEFIERIYKRCARIAIAPHQGHRQESRPGVRITGFERKTSIAFFIKSDTVTILSIAHGDADAGAEHKRCGAAAIEKV